MSRSSDNPIRKFFEGGDPDGKPRSGNPPRIHRRIARVTIAAGFAVTTIRGSLYATMLKVLAKLGQLHRHDHMFKKFMRSPSLASARQLFTEIAVLRDELERYVRADREFGEHCQRRTIQYKNHAARGNKKYQRILKNRKIFDPKGQWVGDIDEAISILTGARTEKQAGKGKNVQILRKAGLLFDTFTLGGKQICVLYPRKHHRAFAKAMNFVCPPLIKGAKRNG